MKIKTDKLKYNVSVVLLGALAVLFTCVLVTSIGKNLIDMMVRVGMAWRHPGNYVGLFAGFVGYGMFLCTLVIPRVRHNLNWYMKFTHELTHTLVALLFFGKIREFVVRDRECYVSYKSGPVGYVFITLAPYCIPIYTFMLFPFRFAGDAGYMIVFDALISFTYAFHIHSFIKQTRLSQPDLDNCGAARSVAFISFVHMAVLSLILAIPKGGVLKALCRVFWEYPVQILTAPAEWLEEILKFF
jgi:hypothetical protein